MAADLETTVPRVRELAGLDGVTAVELLQADPTASGIATNGKALRAGDRSFDALLLIEALEDTALGPAVAAVGSAGDPLIHEQVFSLRAAKGA